MVRLDGGGHGLVLWRKLKPDRWTRTRQAWVAKWWTFNYGRESQGDGLQSSVNLQFLNYWKANLSLQRSWADSPTTVYAIFTRHQLFGLISEIAIIGMPADTHGGVQVRQVRCFKIEPWIGCL